MDIATMKTNPILFLVFIFCVHASAQEVSTAQKVHFPKDKIWLFEKMHAGFKNPLEPFETVSPENAVTKDYEAIKKAAFLVKDSLQLVYTEYYSEKNGQWWSKEDFQNFYALQATVAEKHSFLWDELNLYLPPRGAAEKSHKREMALHSGINRFTGEGVITYQRTFQNTAAMGVSDSINITARVKYLTGFDTIATLDRTSAGKAIKIDGVAFQVKEMSPGLLVLKPLGEEQEADFFNRLRFIAVKDRKIVYPVGTDKTYPSAFLGVTSGYSGFLNTSLLQMSGKEYKSYLENLTFLKGMNQVDQVILKTGVDFDQLHILKPVYDHLSKDLNATRVIRQNVDNLRYHRFSQPLNTPEGN